MTGILVVAHGSRATETELTLFVVVDMLRGMLPDMVIEPAFMAFSENSIEKGMTTLVEKGVTEIKVVPYFLFTGVHLKEDVPKVVSKCMGNHPDIKVEITGTLGADSRIADILVDRIRG